MLGNLAASKVAKIAALCVCPVGAAVVTTQVPQVRSAVHRLTAPPHVPARRLAPRAPRVPEIAQASPCPTAIPVVLQQPDPMAVAMPTLTDSQFNQTILPGAIDISTRIPVAGVEIAPGGGSITPGGPSVLPEPTSWVQFGVGFALLGSAIRAPKIKARLAAAKATRTA